MAQHRQQSNLHVTNHLTNTTPTTSTSAVGGDYVSVGIRPPSYKQPRQRHHRRFKMRLSIATIVSLLCLCVALSGFAFVFFTYTDTHHSSTPDILIREAENDFFGDDFLNNVTRILPKVKFGDGSSIHGRDSRYWDGDDRRRDEDYNEEEYNSRADSDVESGEDHLSNSGTSSTKKSKNHVIEGKGHHGLYNEAGRNELRMYEEKYEASLKNNGKAGAETEDGNHVSEDNDVDMDNEEIDIDDEYDDGIDSHDAHVIDYNENKHENNMNTKLPKSHPGHGRNLGENHNSPVDNDTSDDSSSKRWGTENAKGKAKQASVIDAQLITSSGKQPKRHKKHRKFTSCELKLLNSTAQLVEPLESRKFARFSLSYTEREEKPNDVGNWEPRFAGHQSLREREDSFFVRDQKINCGFVKGPAEYSSTGFDLTEDDSRYISKCHITVVSCIFGNSDRLRTPFVKAISRLSRKNVCFVMFMDEKTLHTTTLEGHTPDKMGFIGLWKVVVVKNLPYTDMRRVGKIPKLLSHRLFPLARFSIWLDSKLRLQRDPLLLLEHFLWQKGHEYAISNHYDRHCVWDEVERNKKLNKFNHTMIDQQFQFYQADGLMRFNASDPGKLLPSNVPEGSLIIRAHTPMSNLFSCLWFNEVEHFTPRDQLSFAYTYQKLTKKNPSSTFYLHMFKDCERRQIVKLFRHRSEDKRTTPQDATE